MQKSKGINKIKIVAKLLVCEGLEIAYIDYFWEYNEPMLPHTMENKLPKHPNAHSYHP